MAEKNSTTVATMAEDEWEIVDTTLYTPGSKVEQPSQDSFVIATHDDAIEVSTIDSYNSNNENDGDDNDKTKPSTLKMMRKTGVAVAGGAMVGVGLVMIPLPTPFGAVIAGSGMAVLGTEFPAAKRALKKTCNAVADTIEHHCKSPKGAGEEKKEESEQEESEEEGEEVVLVSNVSILPESKSTEEKEETDSARDKDKKKDNDPSPTLKVEHKPATKPKSKSSTKSSASSFFSELYACEQMKRRMHFPQPAQVRQQPAPSSSSAKSSNSSSSNQRQKTLPASPSMVWVEGLQNFGRKAVPVIRKLGEGITQGDEEETKREPEAAKTN